MAATEARPAILAASLLVVALGVAPSAPCAPSELPDTACSAETGYESGSLVLDALQAHFRPVLDADRLEFAGRVGRVEGFGAGAEYPQVWLRDGATLVPALRYRVSRAGLESWIEEHLSHQGPGGELLDWIAPGEPERYREAAPRARLAYRAPGVVISADKNTAAADQEASAVDAAYGAFQVTGDRGWLAKPVAGKPLLDRLDAALRFAIRERADDGTGLVRSAFTADWGDVSAAHPDQRAIYLDEETTVVVGLYTNALVAKAAEELALLHGAAGHGGRMREWRAVADSLRASVDRRFWQESAGFYRIHDVVEPRGAAIDDSGIFALGGNAVAVLSGVADARHADRIFAAAEERRLSHGLSSVAGTLLPPYPAGFFQHPLLREPYAYQNGGQWDWWSGRLLLAMFQNGRSDVAYGQLVAVSARVAAAGGLYEWYDREDRGRGSDRYAGNVGALSAAIFQGLFGLDAGADRLDVTVRLGAVPGSVRTCEPATGRRVAYRYSVEPGADRIRLSFEANVPGQGRLAVRLPAFARPTRVELDGRPVRYATDRLGNETYVTISTDWRRHVLELRTDPSRSESSWGP